MYMYILDGYECHLYRRAYIACFLHHTVAPVGRICTHIHSRRKHSIGIQDAPESRDTFFLAQPNLPQSPPPRPSPHVWHDNIAWGPISTSPYTPYIPCIHLLHSLPIIRAVLYAVYSPTVIHIKNNPRDIYQFMLIP